MINLVTIRCTKPVNGFSQGKKYRCIIFDDKAVTHTDTGVRFSLPVLYKGEDVCLNEPEIGFEIVENSNDRY